MSGTELEYIKDAFQQNWIAPIGPHIIKFEEKVKEYVGSKHAIAVNSGTSGIHLALKALKVKRGNKILCSTLTFIGTVNPIIYEGCEPVFIDSEMNTWNMDPHLLEEAIKDLMKVNDKPKAILVVHVFGVPANMNAIKEISIKYEIPIIEDAAESLGSKYKNRYTGTIGDIGIYSFNGNKLLTTSGGGIIITDNTDMEKYMRFLSTQAKDDFPYYHHTEIGYNYKMSNILAAIGIGQIDIIEERINKRREIHNHYVNELNDEITFLCEPKESYSNYWLTCGLLKNINPGDLISNLEKHNIESRRIWNPMHNQPVLKKFKSYKNGNSDLIFDTGICLPSGSIMSDEELNYIIKKIKNNL